MAIAAYNWRICLATSVSTTFDFSKSVDQKYSDPLLSPIDQFIQKNRELNSLLLDPNKFKNKISTLHTKRVISGRGKQELELALLDTSTISPVFANLVLLGHVSAVESYIRAIFRKLILIDDSTQMACYQKALNYGAVLVHDKDSLPDALLELISFSSKRNIEETLKDYFGVKGHFPSGLEPVLLEYSKICQLRHCIVHKFGTLGFNNIVHDLTTNKLLISKPIKNDFASIQEVSQICWNVVHEINQLLWQNSMMRTIAQYDGNKWKKKATLNWKWKWIKDKKLFESYFKIFDSNNFKPPSKNTKAAYLDLQSTYNSLR